MIRFALIGMILLSTSLATAQVPLPDPNLWFDENGLPGGVQNPSGEFAVPAVIYDPADGILWLDTSGIDRDPTQTSGILIEGDNVGFIAISIVAPQEATEFFLDGFVDQSIGGVVWTNQVFGDVHQVFGIGAGAEFLQPATRTDLFLFSPGHSSGAFGEVEMAVNFEKGEPGATMFGSVQFVPEPSNVTLLATALLCVLGILRKYFKSQIRDFRCLAV